MKHQEKTHMQSVSRWPAAATHHWLTKVIPRMIMIAFIVFMISCDDTENDPTPPDDQKVLVSATLVFTISATQVQAVAQLSGLNIDLSKFVSDVDIYKVTYHTEYKDEDIIASGLISLPKNASADAAVLSYQHGTITRDADAPSNFAITKPEALVAGAFSSSGFVTVIPDYVGFGSTASTLHPYYVEDAIATSVVDMLRAAVELADEKRVTLDEKLFLAGYSEGGYATMATHKAIETEGVDGLSLVASFPGAGAFDLQDIQERIFAMETYEHPFYLGYLAMAYRNTYDFNNLITDFFQEPYASRIPTLYDNQKGSGEINAQLTTSIGELIQPELRTGLLTESKYKYLADAFKNNSLTDWVPARKMFIYHGTSDTTVPFENSQHTYDMFIANGADPDVVTFTPIPGDHSSAVTPYVADLLVKLWALR